MGERELLSVEVKRNMAVEAHSDCCDSTDDSETESYKYSQFNPKISSSIE